MGSKKVYIGHARALYMEPRLICAPEAHDDSHLTYHNKWRVFKRCSKCAGARAEKFWLFTGPNYIPGSPWWLACEQSQTVESMIFIGVWYAQVRVLYTAPTLIRALEAHDDSHVTNHKRSSLKVLGSVGEPINPRAWEWFYEVRLWERGREAEGRERKKEISMLSILIVQCIVY